MNPTSFALLALLSFAAVGCDGRTYSMSVDTRPLLSAERGEPAASRAAEVEQSIQSEFTAVALEAGLTPRPPAEYGERSLAAFATEWQKDTGRLVRVNTWLDEEPEAGVYKAWVGCFPDFDTGLAADLRRDLKARMRKQFPGAKLRYGRGW
jgi:hypothetical protein